MQGKGRMNITRKRKKTIKSIDYLKEGGREAESKTLKVSIFLQFQRLTFFCHSILVIASLNRHEFLSANICNLHALFDATAVAVDCCCLVLL